MLTKTRICFIISLFFFILIPSFPFRIGLFCAIIFLLLHDFFVLKRTYVFLSLFILFSFAYIFSPYWLAFKNIVYNLLALGFLTSLGLTWAYLSSADIKISTKLLPIKYYFILLISLFIINYFPINNDIAWRGDEDTHLHFILDLFIYLQKTIGINQNAIFLFIICLLVVLFLYFFGKNAIRSIKGNKNIILSIWLLLIPFFSFFVFPPGRLSYDQMDKFSVWQILRFPYLSKWLNAFFIYPGIYSDIKLYRAIPFLSVVFMSWFLFYKFNKKTNDKFLSLLFSLSVTTIPLLYFYSNLLYLEMPVVFLMLVCVFNLKNLINDSSRELMKSHIWYCLLICSFLKETVFIFLILIMGVRLFHQLKMNNMEGIILKRLYDEIKIILLVLTPSLIYLFFRQFFLNYRSYGGEFMMLFNFSNYLIIMQALLKQTGFLFLLSIMGFFFILYKKDKFQFFSLLILFMGIICFFMIDMSIFLGYSRWNLFVLPIIIYVSFLLMVSLKKVYRIVIILLLIISNVFFCPFKTDAARLSNWGSPSFDTAEYLYPYEKAIKWLSDSKKTKKLLVMGQYYRYAGLRFYFGKYQFFPEKIEYPFGWVRFDKNTEISLLNLFFQNYQRKELEEKLLEADTILYHSVNNLDLDSNILYGGSFRIAKKINNSQNSLYIFQKIT